MSEQEGRKKSRAEKKDKKRPERKERIEMKSKRSEAHGERKENKRAIGNRTESFNLACSVCYDGISEMTKLTGGANERSRRKKEGDYAEDTSSRSTRRRAQRARTRLSESESRSDRQTAIDNICWRDVRLSSLIRLAAALAAAAARSLHECACECVRRPRSSLFLSFLYVRRDPSA